MGLGRSRTSKRQNDHPSALSHPLMRKNEPIMLAEIESDDEFTEARKKSKIKIEEFC